MIFWKDSSINWKDTIRELIIGVSKYARATDYYATMEKDFVRIPKSYRPIINTLEGKIVFEKEEELGKLLSNVLENYFLIEK